MDSLCCRDCLFEFLFHSLNDLGDVICVEGAHNASIFFVQPITDNPIALAVVVSLQNLKITPEIAWLLFLLLWSAKEALCILEIITHLTLS